MYRAKDVLENNYKRKRNNVKNRAMCAEVHTREKALEAHNSVTSRSIIVVSAPTRAAKSTYGRQIKNYT